MNAARVPRSMIPANTSTPPRHRARAVAMAPRFTTRGMKTALRTAALMAAPFSSPVTTSNSSWAASSRARVLLVTAPMTPSLKAPVIRLLALRTMRCWRRMRRWKYRHSTASRGVMASTSSPSFQFITSSTTITPMAKVRAHMTSTTLQAIISLRRDTSLPIRAMSQPTLVVS